MFKFFRLFAVIFLIIGVFVFFLMENDEKYLQKTTFKLLNLASVPVQEINLVALLKRVEQMAKYVHFDVQFKLQANGQTWEGRSAGELRTLLLTYFKRGGLAQITADNMSIQIDSSTPKGHVRFKAHGLQGDNKVSCEAHLVWIKEKKWFIKEIEVFSCSPAPS